MRGTRITVPELALIAGTRAALGAGIGMLVADRFTAEQRKATGWTLFLIGALTTIPLAFEVFGGRRDPDSGSRSERSDGRLPPEGYEPSELRSTLAEF